jgi:DNA-binding NarL/FixJ family response regulator
MAQRRISRFPHWWHPSIIAKVCTYALAADLYPEVVERMLVHQLGEAGVHALRMMLEGEETAARTRAYQIFQLVATEAPDELSHLRESQAKRVLSALLRDGRLRRDGLARLQTELTTAQRRQKPNATIMAVFALYVNGSSRTEIAEQLACSIANVRNYITVLYHHFGIADGGFPTRRSRQRRLMELARERGFI